jgi:hypothetical protein
MIESPIMSSEQTEASTSAQAAATAFASKADAGHATTATGAEAALTPREDFVIECLRNARYHEDRERFFARIHRIAMFVTVASGTATFAWLKTAPWTAPWFLSLITLAGLLDLVFDVSGKARLHASLRRRIYDILAQTEDSDRKLENLREQAVKVYADEPPSMHAANMIAFNGAMESMHRPHRYLYKIEWYHRFFRNVWPFATTNFKTFGDIEAATDTAH